MPPSRTWPKASTSVETSVMSPPSFGIAPSETTMIGEYCVSKRFLTCSHTASMSKGCSGMSTALAPPAMPAWRAIQPAWRPITSTTSTRWWDSAVVCRRSMASIAMLTAVSKPKVKSVPDRSLSMVLGTPTTFTPRSASLVATPRVSSPPIATRASTPSAARFVLDPLDAAVDLERVGAARAEDGAAAREDAAALLDAEVHRQALERALPAVAVADELEAVHVDALADDGADDRVEAGTVPASGEHSDLHGAVTSPDSFGSFQGLSSLEQRRWPCHRSSYGGTAASARGPRSRQMSRKSTVATATCQALVLDPGGSDFGWSGGIMSLICAVPSYAELSAATGQDVIVIGGGHTATRLRLDKVLPVRRGNSVFFRALLSGGDADVPAAQRHPPEPGRRLPGPAAPGARRGR